MSIIHLSQFFITKFLCQFWYVFGWVLIANFYIVTPLNESIVGNLVDVSRLCDPDRLKVCFRE